MRDDLIDLSEIVALIRRNILGVAAIAGICAFVTLMALFVLPKKYKSKAVLNIQASYFKTPLVSDLITEVNDASESNAQRLSLLRLALNDSFLDELAEKYKVYKRPHDARLQAIESEMFL